MENMSPSGSPVEKAFSPVKRGVSGARQRQMLYDLEKHPFESNTLTQLFQILSKRRASWWKDQEGDEAGSNEKHNATHNSDQSLHQTTMNSSLAPPHKSQKPIGVKGLMQSIESLTQRDRQVRRPVVSVRKGTVVGDTAHDAHQNHSSHPQELLIPDTVVWENNIPKGWFFFDPKEGHVSRRKVETKQVQEAFLRDALFENDIVAVLFSSPHHQGEGAEELLYRYLTAAELPIFLFENRRGKGTSILQKFVYPLNVNHNDCIQVTWSPSVTQVSRRQNINDLFDERIPPNERCATFEGRTHLSKDVQCTPRLKHSIEQSCKEFVNHFHETDSKHVISRMVIYVKISDASETMLLYCSSVRIQKAQVAAVLPLASGSALAIADGGNSMSSQLHMKYRVSLELATKFAVKDIDEGFSSKSKTDNGGRDVGRRQSMMNPNGPTHDKDIKEPSLARVPIAVGNRTAAHHGFMMRAHTPSSSQKSTSGEHSRRPSSSLGLHSTPSQGRLSIHSVVHDVMRFEDSSQRLEEVSAVAKNKARLLLQAAVKKVGTAAARAALLQTRPSSELEDFEKMELLFLKVSETDRRKVRRASNAASESVRRCSVQESVDMSLASDKGGLTSVMAHSVRNVVFEGVHPFVDPEVETRWSELCYSAQAHFDVQPSHNDTHPFVCPLHGDSSPIDGTIIAWLRLKSATLRDSSRPGMAVVEGANLSFTLKPRATDGQQRQVSTRECVLLTVPAQSRAAQKLYHFAHDALTSRQFGELLVVERQKDRSNVNARLSIAALTASEQDPNDVANRMAQQKVENGALTANVPKPIDHTPLQQQPTIITDDQMATTCNQPPAVVVTSHVSETSVTSAFASEGPRKQDDSSSSCDEVVSNDNGELDQGRGEPPAPLMLSTPSSNERPDTAQENGGASNEETVDPQMPSWL